MKLCLRKYIQFIFTLALLHVGAVVAFAQTPPASLAVNSSTLYLLSTTSGNPESIDTVMTGATLPYYVYPDADFNPAFDNTSPLSNIESSFGWSAAVSGQYSVAAVGTYPTNYKNITWNTAGTYTITVTETSAAAYGGCSGDYSFSVVVAAKPTAVFTSTATLACPQSGTYTIALPIINTSGIASATEKHVQYSITMVYAGGTTPAPTMGTVPMVTTGATSVSVDLNNLPEGRYVFTLTAVSDRISRKCSVAGVLGAQVTYTLYVTSPKPTLRTSAIQ